MPTVTTSKTAAELRRAFLDFFVKNSHVEVPSSPLVPSDPSLLFTTAGMVQFKPYYTASDVPYTRAVSVQKCLRLTDLENVGVTPRHDTFFEMLGNFSFGPREKGAYFKDEAIAFAWEFVTKTLGMPTDRLYPSVFEGEGSLPRDDEAIELWKKMGVPESRIVPLGRKDNFWGPAGGQGACGPCSEIYFDLGERRPAYLAEGAFWGDRPGDAGDRYMEFWNLVFPQFDAQPDGKLVPLARPGIDTGMGIERLSLIMQGRNTIFETDVFEPLIRPLQERARSAFSGPNAATAMRDARIIADHVRALVFAIAEGALPSNEGAGYVLRRLLRRAVARARSARGLNLQDLRTTVFTAKNAINVFAVHYHELEAQRDQIIRVLSQEEDAFVQTFDAGLARLEKLLAAGRVDGAEAFVLHDTYGFPIELTEEIAAERGAQVDRAGFERAMDEQRGRARAASKFGKTGTAAAEPWTGLGDGEDSVFLGYGALDVTGVFARRWREAPNGAFELVLSKTPFYAESGGQVADRGTLSGEGAIAGVEHVYKEGDTIVHRARLREGQRERLFAAGYQGRLNAQVDPAHRAPTQRHHTATHLLHAALRHTLGTHVRQAGSLVAPDRLRFDYTHFEAAAPEQLAAIERMVVEWALANREVTWKVMPIDEARAQGAMALFGEKYGAEVRMVSVPGVAALGIPDSRELCGGTHVARTGDIGAFVLVSDSAIAAGVRRVEALCGVEALAWLREQGTLLHRAAAALQARPSDLPEQIEKLKSENTALKKSQADAQKGGLKAEMAKLAQEASPVNGGKVVVAEVRSEADANAVREAADQLRGALKRGAAVLALQGEGKLTFVAAVTDDLVAEKKLNASDLVKKVAQVTGGSGGGKPHLALAGGKDAAKLPEALAEARRLIAEALGG